MRQEPGHGCEGKKGRREGGWHCCALQAPELRAMGRTWDRWPSPDILVSTEWLSWFESFEDPYWGFLGQLMAKNLPDLSRLSLPHGQPETGGVGLEEGRDGMAVGGTRKSWAAEWNILDYWPWG